MAVLASQPALTVLPRSAGFGGVLTVHSVPYIVFGADLVCSLASGMTINFFPLFFKAPMLPIVDA